MRSLIMPCITAAGILLLSSCIRGSNLCVQVWEHGQVAEAVYLVPQQGSNLKSIVRVPELYKADGELYVKGIRTQLKRHTAYSHFSGKESYSIIPENGETVVYHQVRYECDNPLYGFLEKKGDEGWVTQLPPGAQQINNKAAWESSMYWVDTPEHGLTITYDEPVLHSTPHALYATPLAIATGATVDLPITLIATTVATAWHVVVEPINEIFRWLK